MTYKNITAFRRVQNKPNLVRPALFAKESLDWSNPTCQACVVCEGVAGLIKPIALSSVNTNSWSNKAICHFFLDRSKYVCILGQYEMSGVLYGNHINIVRNTIQRKI